MTMGSSRWPGARKLYCLSLCFVNPVVNTCGDEHSQLPASSELTQRYNSIENLYIIDLSRTWYNHYQAVLEVDCPRPLAPLVRQRLLLHVASAGVDLGGYKVQLVLVSLCEASSPF